MGQTFYYRVGEHALAVCFADKENDDALIPSFAPFRLDEKPDDLLFTLTVDDHLEWPENGEEIGQFDCGGCNHGVYRLADGGYHYSIEDVQGVLCSRMRSNADFSACQVSLFGTTWAQRNYGLNNALMMAYAFSAACLGTMLMHASVIRCDGWGYLMTAPSGTGKSTHTRLWYDNIPGCDLMNDDNPIVRIIGGQAFVYGDVTRVRRGYYNCEMKVIRRDTKDIPDYELTDIYFHELEKTILRQPEIYLWSHNRWKRTREEFNRYYYVDDNGKVIMRKNLS